MTDDHIYKPPESLWHLVESFVPEDELPEIRLLLGDSLIDQSLELHEEIGTIYDMLCEMKSENEQRHLRGRLPEPPKLRENLENEIRFFVDNLKNSQLSPSTHDMNVLDYVTRPGSSGYNSRPSTSSDRFSSMCSSSELTARSCPTPEVERNSLNCKITDINEKLNITKFDEIKFHLRDVLSEEIDMLVKDISYLQNCLEDESFNDYSAIPTLTDLRDERGKLEKELLSGEKPFDVKRTPTPPREAKKLFTARIIKPLKDKLAKVESIPPFDRLILREIDAEDGVTPPATPPPRRPFSTGSPHQTDEQLVTTMRINVDPPTHITIRLRSAGSRTPLKAIHPAPRGLPQAPIDVATGSTKASSRFRRMVASCRTND